MSRWYKAEGITLAKVVDIPPVWLVGFLALVWVVGALLPGAVAQIWIVQLFGGGLCALGVALMVWAIAAFRAHQTSVVPHQTPARIITSGPFARTRNPIYLGDVMVLLGATLWLGIWPGLVVIPIFVLILMRRFIAPEEVRMKESFGAEFDRFTEKTPRWF